MRMKSLLLNTAKLLFVAVLIGYLIHAGKLDLRQLPLALQSPHWIFLALTVMFLEILLCAVRWRLLLRAIGVVEGFWNIFHFTWIGMLFNNVMLGSVGGDVVKVVYVVRHFPEKKVLTGMTVLLDRVIGLYSMILLIATSFLFMPSSLSEVKPIAALQTMSFVGVLASFVVIPMMFSQRFRTLFPEKGRLADVVDALRSFKDQKKLLLSIIGLGYIGHAGLIIAVHAIAQALSPGLDTGIPFKVMGFVVPLGMMTLAIPVAPAGMGVGQAAFSQLFQWVGATNASLGGNAITLYQVLFMSLNLFGVFSFLKYKREEQVPVGKSV